MALIRPLEALLGSIGCKKGEVGSQRESMEYLFVSDGVRWTSRQYGMALQQAFQANMGEEIGIREYRQIQASISGHRKEILADTDDAALEQQGHTTATHNRDYNRLAEQSAGFKDNSQLMYEGASVSWQELVFPGGDKVQRSLKEFGDPTYRQPVAVVEVAGGSGGTGGRSFVRDTLPPLRALVGLRAVLGNPTATFKSHEQAIATAAMLEQTDERSVGYREDLLIVLPTGMGKTLTWMVAQHLEDRDSITIVIVPLAALLLDLAARLKAYGQPVHVYGEALGLESRSGFVLTSAEKVVRDPAVREIHAMEHKIVSAIGGIAA